MTAKLKGLAFAVLTFLAAIPASAQEESALDGLMRKYDMTFTLTTGFTSYIKVNITVYLTRTHATPCQEWCCLWTAKTESAGCACMSIRWYLWCTTGTERSRRLTTVAERRRDPQGRLCGNWKLCWEAGMSPLPMSAKSGRRTTLWAWWRSFLRQRHGECSTPTSLPEYRSTCAKRYMKANIPTPVTWWPAGTVTTSCSSSSWQTTGRSTSTSILKTWRACSASNDWGFYYRMNIMIYINDKRTFWINCRHVVCSSVAASESPESVSGRLQDRWHFGMKPWRAYGLTTRIYIIYEWFYNIG